MKETVTSECIGIPPLDFCGIAGTVATTAWQHCHVQRSQSSTAVPCGCIYVDVYISAASCAIVGPASVVTALRAELVR